jgi:class 3 adenylate cyclase
MDVLGSGEDFSQDPKFLEAKSRKTYFGPVYFRKGSEPYMTIAITGHVKGAGGTVAEVNLKFFWDVVSQIKVGKAGRAYAVDYGGKLIAHPDISLVLKKTDLSSLPQVTAARESPHGSDETQERVSVARDFQGQQVLTAYAAIALLRWFIFLEQPLAEAFEPLYQPIFRTAILMLAGIVLSVLASLALAHRMVTPIRALQGGAARIGAGDLGHRIEVRTGDELEILGEEFNRMTTQLQASYTHLEDKVKERTRTVREQAARLEEQSAQLEEWNRTLEKRVAEQLAELERVGRLGRFLSPQLVELIVSSEDESLLESHRREITVVFCDLRGFTAFSETGEPEEIMGVLREYHAAMGTLIFRFEGTLERFAGDGLMVFFNDPLPCPDPAVRAVRMAVAMRERVRELSGEWLKRGHQLDFGVGIAQGYATLGKIGFEGRFDYAAIGTVTNLASRLCDEAQASQILISQRVYAGVEGLVEVETLGDLALKGMHRPVPTYNVVSLKGESTAS